MFKKSRHLLSILLSLAIVISFIPVFTLSAFSLEDYGTAGNPYLIRTPQELDAVRNDLSKHYKLAANIDLDISPYNQESGWVPIGDPENAFTGSFDGNGYTISNLYIVRPSSAFQGLFGAIDFGGTVKNLGMVDGYLDFGDFSGSVAGENNGLIENCYNTNTVNSPRSSGIGGVVGINGFVNTYATVANCYNTGEVTSLAYVGGVVGENAGLITGCWNSGKLFGGFAAGGVVGFNTLTVNKCYSIGPVSGGGHIGGFVGINDGDGTISNCYATGNVSEATMAGGFVGKNGYNISGATITNCYATGAVSGTVPIRVPSGFAGGNENGIISNCYWNTSATETGIGDAYSTGTLQLTGKTLSEMCMSAFAGELGGAWIGDENTQGGLPYLSGVTPAAFYAVRVLGSEAINGNWVRFYYPGETAIVTLDPGTKSGYTFTGWKSTPSIPSDVPYFPMPKSTVIITAQWAPTGIGTDTGTGGGTAVPPPTQPPKAPVVPVDYTIDAKGTATLKPTPAQMNALLNTINSNGELVFTTQNIPGMTAAVLEMDLTALLADSMLQSFTFSALGMKVCIPVGALKSMQARSNPIRFVLASGSIIFKVTDVNGNEIDWNDYANPVTVYMPYLLPQDVSAHQVVLVHANGTIVPRSWYADGWLYGKISKPGTYDAAIKPLANFSDTSGKWMAEAVNYMGIRAIITGRGFTGEGDNRMPYFAPDSPITRAEFLTLIMRAFSPEPQGTWLVQQFSDVPDGVYYYELTLRAKALGIVGGVGENRLNPDDVITRQDMFAMTYRAMEILNMLPEAMTAEFVLFNDGGAVADYAVNPIQILAKLKLANGFEGNINPTGTATRAEAAQFLYNILKYDAQ